MNQPKCPNCTRPMVAGFVLKPAEKRIAPNIWAEGELWQYMFYGGKGYPIVTYRCPGCVRPRSYALEGSERGNH